jgi:hypothetical protein
MKIQKLKPKNLEDLRHLIFSTWNSLSKQDISNTIDHNIKVVKKVIEVNGNFVKSA